MLGRLAERAGELGDSIGGREPASAAMCYGIAGRLTERARDAAAWWQESGEGGPR